MATKHRIVPFEFNWSKFSADLRKNLKAGDIVTAAQIIGVDYSTLANWRKGAYRGRSYPMMHNFINACNVLDLDPRDYFWLMLSDDTK